MKRNEVLRILDANFNRSREGLRVCEEIARFILEDKVITKDLKRARHGISACIKKMSIAYSKLVTARDTDSDVGKMSSLLERERRSAFDLFVANAQRAKESLRVLEEMLKFVSGGSSGSIKKIRFRVYAIEKKALPRLEALRYH